MEINAANVAWHKMFGGKLSSVGKKKKKKKKIGELSTDKIQEITDNAIPLTTTKKQNENKQQYVPVKFHLKAVKFQTWTSRFYAFMKIT